MCSVGDLKNNVRILQSEARVMKYNKDFDLDGLTKGDPQALLPLYNHIFTFYNSQFSTKVLEVLDDSLYMKSDVRFMESVYKVLRDLLNFKPSMTKEQFFTLNNFAERKIIMCVDIMRLVQTHCRYMGPKNPTNPHIKVTSVVDTGRSNKKSPAETVTSEPAADSAVSRKVSSKSAASASASAPPSKPNNALLGINENGWELKLGYLRPNQSNHPKPKDVKKDPKKKDDASDKSSVSGEKTGLVASVVREFSPPAFGFCAGKLQHQQQRASSVDRQQGQGQGQLRTTEASPPKAGSAHSDWDPSEAVEVILAKVKDLPTQLNTFMKAVESRLVSIEDRLGSVESRVSSSEQRQAQTAPSEQVEPSSELRQQMDTLNQRLLLMDNRMTLLEAKGSGPGKAVEGAKPAPLVEAIKATMVVEEKRADFIPGPFVSLERGEDLLFSEENLATTTFSPIRQELGDFSPLPAAINTTENDSLAVLQPEGGGEERRLSSTPNQSGSLKPLQPCRGASSNSSGVVGRERNGGMGVEDSTVVAWENLDSSTVQQVERIRDMLKATQGLLPTPPSPSSPSSTHPQQTNR